MVFRFAARFACAAGIALCLSTPSPAFADDDATVETARQRFKEGVQFYDQKQYEKARLAFLQAYTLKPHPSVLLNLAQSELRADRLDDSANHFAEYLRSASQAPEAERSEAESGFTIAKSRTGEIAISAEPSGAQVYVDGVDRGASPLPGPVYVVPGTHTVEIRANDKRSSKQVVVGAAQAASVSVSLRGGEEAPASTPEPEGDSEGSGDKSEGQASASVTSGEQRNFFEWFGDTPGAWVTAGVAVAGLATGGVFAGLATRDYNTAKNAQGTLEKQFSVDIIAAPELARYSPCRQPSADETTTPEARAARSNSARVASFDSYCKKFSDAADSGDRNRTIAIIGAAVGGAAVIGTVIYYLVDGEEKWPSAYRPNTIRARLVPSTGPTFNGLTVIGTF